MIGGVLIGGLVTAMHTTFIYMKSSNLFLSVPGMESVGIWSWPSEGK
jgi:hypothetical protein